MYNRKQRRELEKASGLFEQYQKASSKEKSEIRERRRLAGHQIHLHNVQEAENASRERAAELEAQQLRSMIEKGTSEEEAKRILANNQEVRRKREERKRKSQENKI
jgi:hypothetical protein